MYLCAGAKLDFPVGGSFKRFFPRIYEKQEWVGLYVHLLLLGKIQPLRPVILPIAPSIIVLPEPPHDFP